MAKVYTFTGTKTLECECEFGVEAESFAEAEMEATRRLKAGELEWDVVGEGRAEVSCDDEDEE